LHSLALFCVKNANIFAIFLAKIFFLIITSVPGRLPQALGDNQRCFRLGWDGLINDVYDRRLTIWKLTICGRNFPVRQKNVAPKLM
jgi:hypothetical protein